MSKVLIILPLQRFVDNRTAKNQRNCQDDKISKILPFSLDYSGSFHSDNEYKSKCHFHFIQSNGMSWSVVDRAIGIKKKAQFSLTWSAHMQIYWNSTEIFFSKRKEFFPQELVW